MSTPWPRLAEQGFRWPAEWEPHRATWIAWPHNALTWPGRLDAVEQAFVAIVHALLPHETVCIQVADDAMAERVHERVGAKGATTHSLELHTIPTDDAWVRDHGPLFVVRDTGAARERVLVDFRFDAWGRKYEPWLRDDAVPRRVAAALGLPVHRTELVLEGGSIDGNGAGDLLTTESCLLHPNRGEGRTRELLEEMLHDVLGAKRVVWLAGGVAGDDTDGHVDDVARFVAPDLVVAATEGDPADANHAPLEENLRRLRAMSVLGGRRLRVATLPMPPPMTVDELRCPASYLNFYLANGVALVPTFGVGQDGRALSVLSELLEGREVVGIPSSDLVVGLGAVHCLTQQEPVAQFETRFSPL